jgi:transcriptional regulator with XRE-family HTH domain
VRADDKTVPLNLTGQACPVTMAAMRSACVNPERINAARLRAGMTQADVAYRLRERGHKANERSIRRWESGQHAPHANVVPALAEALNVTMDDLYTSDEMDEEEDESSLRRLAHIAIDRDQPDIAAALLDRVKLMKARREERVS